MEWPEEPLPTRTTDRLQRILKEGDGPFLLGACQTLVESGRILLERSEPADNTFRGLWALLPDSTRKQIKMTTFAYSNTLGFDLLAMPKLPESMRGYLTEDQARDYPESRYERELQVAVEMGDQAALDRLLWRRSSSETLRLAFWLVIGALVLSFASKFLLR